MRGETVNDRPLVVRRYRSVEEITVCHILFISRREDRRIKGILEDVQGDALTVLDEDQHRRYTVRFGDVRLARLVPEL